MKQVYLKSFFLSLLMMVIGNVGAFAAEEETIASFTASAYNGGTTNGWTVSNANYATGGGGYYQLTYANASIVTPAINWSEYSNITITISARKYGGPDTTQGRISVYQGETELTSYSPSGTSIVASSALEISPEDGSITISCPDASSNKGCGVGTIVIKGTKAESTATLTSIELSGDYPTVFYVNDVFSHEGMTVTAYYDDGSDKDVTNNSNVTFSEPDMSTPAEAQTVTVSYTEGDETRTAEYTIEVKERRLASITLSGDYQTEFNVGDTFSHEGLVVTANYDDESTKDVTELVTFIEPDMSTAGENKQVSVIYAEGNSEAGEPYYITVKAVAVTGITLDQEATILVGNTKTLTATITPGNATDKSVTWTSSDESVATVGEDGTVSAVAEGDATITATANGGENITATCAVTVVSELNETTATGNLNNTDSGVFAGIDGFTSGTHEISGTLSTAVGDVTVKYAGSGSSYLNNTHIRMYKSGSMLKFTAPEGYELTKIVFTISSGNSANLDADAGSYSAGTWTGTESELTFTGKNATIQLTTAKVTLEKKVETGELLSIAVVNPKTEFSVGDTFEFGGTVTAAYDNGATKDVTDDVTFTGYNMNTAGEQTVTVSYTEDEVTQTTEYTITVSEVAVTGITLDQEEATILVGVTKTLTATIEPENATDKTVIWTSSDEDVATVDENGVVTAVAAGTATITATSNENDEITASCAVTVVDEIEETTATGNLNNSTTGVFAGITGFTNGGHNITGKLATDAGDVTVNYAGTSSSYLNEEHIRMYATGTTLKFTAPDGYELTKIVLTKTSGNLTTDLKTDVETYSDGTWEGTAESVTFTGQNATIRLSAAEVTLQKAAPKSPLAGLRVEGFPKDEFLVGDAFVFDATVIAIYEDETEKDVTEEAEFSGYDMGVAGEYQVTVSYSEGELTETTQYDITVREAETVTFRKISSTDGLEAGKRYVLVNEENQKAIAEYYNYHFEVDDATISDERVTLVESKANFLTLGGEEDAWTFATSIESGMYLALTGDNNYLESGDDATADAAQWTISFDEDGNAVIQSNYKTERYIRYNSNQPRFACYKGTQKPVQLYVEVDENDVDLTISSVGYATLYYSDRALKVPAGVTAKTYKVVDGKLTESKAYEASSVIPAGEAVVLKGAAGDYTFFASSTTDTPDADNQLKGTDEAEETTGGTYYYALQAKAKDGSGGPGMYWMNSTGAAFTNGAHKAYMALDEMFAEVQGLAKSFYLFDEAMGIGSVVAEGIERGDAYNLNGQRVGSGYKGVVIVNGKKFMKK